MSPSPDMRVNAEQAHAKGEAAHGSWCFKSQCAVQLLGGLKQQFRNALPEPQGQRFRSPLALAAWSKNSRRSQRRLIKKPERDDAARVRDSKNVGATRRRSTLKTIAPVRNTAAAHIRGLIPGK